MGAEENRQIAREFTERMGKGDSLALDELTTENYVLHVMSFGFKDKDYDRNVFRQTNESGHKGMPDYTMTVDEIVAEGDRVFVWSTRRGTDTGGFVQGLPPTGKFVKITRFALYRFENGKIAEMWAMDDLLGQHQQLGYLPLLQDMFTALREKNKKP